MRSRPQAGATGAILLAILALIMGGMLAAYALSRINNTTGSNADTLTRLESVRESIDQYAANTRRLPCPADPSLDTGLEVPAGSACSFPTGTLPWATIGLNRDLAFDLWGRKISYRVYTGAAGSLTVAGGVSMVNCDTVEPNPAGTNASGQCEGATPADRRTKPEAFLANKGLSLKDDATTYADVAYVVISHGETGLGAYSASGIQRALPAGDERDNTRATATFVRKAFSDPEVAATVATHFDDLVAYRRLPDLVKIAKLEARDWQPDPAPAVTGATFDQATVTAAVGSPTPVTSGTTGRSSITVSGVTVTASGGSSQVSFEDGFSGGAGIGVSGGAGNTLLEGDTGAGPRESLRFDFPDRKRRFGITFNTFDFYDIFGIRVVERMEFTFYRGGSTVLGPLVKDACRDLLSLSGPLSSYEIDAGADYDAVVLRPVTLTVNGGGGVYDTAVLVSAFSACDSTASSCRSPLATDANTCP